MISVRADLHLHSIYSDGVLLPTDLIEYASKIGLKGLSITDHDTVEAYFDPLFSSKKKNISILPGIELSCSYRGRDVHILGYGFEPDHLLLRAWCRKYISVRLKRVHFYFDRWESSFRFSTCYRDEFFVIHSSRLLTRLHLAQFLVKKGLARHLKDAFFRFLDFRVVPLPSSLAFPDVIQGIELLHSCGAFVVLAHPYTIHDQVVDSTFLSLPFDGVELMHGGHCINGKWANWARSRNLYCTGGSDFHDFKRGHCIGSSWTTWEIYQIFSGGRSSSLYSRLP